MQFQGNLDGAILDLLMKEVKLDTSTVVTSKVLMTLVKEQMLVTHMVLTILVLTGQDHGEINQRYTLGGGGTARTDAIQNYVESHMGMIWHNVTDDFRVIAEGVYSEAHWHGAVHKKAHRFLLVHSFSGRIFTSNILYI